MAVERDGAGEVARRDTGAGGRQRRQGEGGLQGGGFARWEVGGPGGAADDGDDAGPIHEADGELQHREAEHRVEQERQAGDHEQGAAVAQLVAQFPEPD